MIVESPPYLRSKSIQPAIEVKNPSENLPQSLAGTTFEQNPELGFYIDYFSHLSNNPDKFLEGAIIRHGSLRRQRASEYLIVDEESLREFAADFQKRANRPERGIRRDAIDIINRRTEYDVIGGSTQRGKIIKRNPQENLERTINKFTTNNPEFEKKLKFLDDDQKWGARAVQALIEIQREKDMEEENSKPIMIDLERGIPSKVA